MTTEIRPIEPLTLGADVVPGPVGPPPDLIWLDPRQLVVEDRYQRGLSKKSLVLIQRIVAHWDWRACKPPIVAHLEGPDGEPKRYAVIDGQHTAIAAVTHGGIAKLPCVLVSSETMGDRAQAFMGHNRDRISLTPCQLHHSAVAAGDEVAVALDEACRRAGARILKNPQSRVSSLKVGDTMAASALTTICRDKGVNFTSKLLKILVDAQRAPIGATEIRVVYELLTDADWRQELSPEAIATTLRSRTADGWATHAEAYVRKGNKHMPIPRSIAIAVAQKTPKRKAAA